MEAVSKLAQVQQLPPPPSQPQAAPTPLLLEMRQLRQEIEALRQAQEEHQTKQELENLRSSVESLSKNVAQIRITKPSLLEIKEMLQAELAITKKDLLAETAPEVQKIFHAELEGALLLSKKRLDALPQKIVQALPKPKKGLFG